MTIELSAHADEDVLKLIHAQLIQETATEADRRRAVEAKLVATSSVAPIAVSVLAGVVTFLTSGNGVNFTGASIVSLAIIVLYVAIQFLRATLAAIQGLRRMSYAAPRIPDVLNQATDSEATYLKAGILGLAARIEQHREATNERVSRLALAHESIINAVCGLVIGSGILVTFTIFGNHTQT